LSPNLPAFSIIVPTFGRPERLDHCLAAITRLDYPQERFEVIVVDDGSPQSVQQIVERHTATLEIRLLRQAHQGVSAARNLGAREARGVYLAFTADDCLPAATWLRALAACLEQVAESTALGGMILNGREDNIFAVATQLVVEYVCQAGEQGTLAQRFFTPNNLVVPAAEFRRLGGFDPAYTWSAGEDRDYCARWIEHGFRLGFCRNAQVVHQHPLGFFSFLHLHWRYGRGSGMFRRRKARRMGGVFRLERPAFYLGLLLYPWRQHGFRALPVTALIALTQVFSGAGVVLEWARSIGRH
jgi:glycosyltransferase involved in cell wall biosynthesis